MSDFVDETAALAFQRFDIGRWHLVHATGELWWDDGMRRITGRSTPVTPASWFSELVHPDDREMVEVSTRILARGGPFTVPEYRVARPDGEIRWLRMVGEVHVGPDGAPVRAAGPWWT